MQFGFTHGSLKAEQQPVVEVRRIIDAVFIQNERVRQCADFQQPVPVRGVACQTGHLQAQDNTGAAHADFGDELLKTLAVHGRSAGLAEIGVDDNDLPFRPSQRDRPLAQLASVGQLPPKFLPQSESSIRNANAVMPQPATSQHPLPGVAE